MPYTLYYFAAKGRAEAARVTMAAAGVEWDDKRIGGEDWAKLKPDTPFGQMPVLQAAGKGMIAQSGAIVRYLGREHGMDGKDSYEQAQVDQIMGGIDDLHNAFVKVMFEKDAEKKKEMDEKFRGETLPQMLERMEKLAGNGNFVGDKMTIADTCFFTFMQHHAFDLKAYPKLQAVFAKVNANKGVAAWIAKRPESAF